MFVLVACTSAEPPISASELDTEAEPPPVVAARAKPVEQARELTIEHRLRGPIEGSFVVPRQQVHAAEPIMVAFEVRPTKGPLTVFVGGDMRNAASFPMRVGVKAVNATDGTVVCDSVSAPELPTFGGPGGDRTLAEGELLRETFALNAACLALATPGRYRVTLHRRLTNMAMVAKVGRDAVPTSCERQPLHEDSSLAGMPAECIPMLEATPSVTTSFALTVLPYEPMAVRAAIDDVYARAQASTPVDETGLYRMNLWMCGWVTCDCSPPLDARKMLLPDTTPPIADKCNRAAAR